MQHLEVSGAVRPLKWSLGVKWLIYKTLREYLRLAANFHHFRILSNLMADYLLSVAIKVLRIKFKNVYVVKKLI